MEKIFNLNQSTNCNAVKTKTFLAFILGNSKKNLGSWTNLLNLMQIEGFVILRTVRPIEQ